MSRRGRGEGAVYRDGDRWIGQLDLGRDADGKRIRRKVRGRTKSEVTEKLRQARKQSENSAPGGRSSITSVGELLTRWVDTVAAARVGKHLVHRDGRRSLRPSF